MKSISCSISLRFFRNCFLFCVFLVTSITVFGFSGGDGSLGDPYQITDCTELQEMNDAANNYENLTKNYILMNDIDCSTHDGVGENPDFVTIGDNTGGDNDDRFSGTFTSNGDNIYTIKNVTVSAAGTDFIGLFGFTNSAEFSDFNVQNINLTGKDYVGVFADLEIVSTVDNVTVIDVIVSGESYVGGMFGRMVAGTMTESGVFGSDVTGTTDYVGGFGGYISSGTTLRRNFAVDVDVDGNIYVGGFLGTNRDNVTLSDLFVWGEVDGTDEQVGGLIGRSYTDNASTLSNSYTNVDVTGDNRAGGLIGFNDSGGFEFGDFNISNSFIVGSVALSNGLNNDIGALFANLGVVISDNNFWNDTNNNPDECYEGGNVGCTAIDDDLTYFYDSTNEPYAGDWDFDTVWLSLDNRLPLLRWAIADPALSVTVANDAVVGDANNVTFTLTTPRDLATGDRVIFALPENFDITDVAFVSDTFAGFTFSACNSVSDQIVCLIEDEGANGAEKGTGNIVVSGVKSLYADEDQTLDTYIEDASAENIVIAYAQDDMVDSTAGSLVDANVEPANLVATAEPLYTASFTTNVLIPQGGKIKLFFPVGFDVSGLFATNAGNLSGLDGSWSVSVAGQFVTLTQIGGTDTEAGVKSFTLTGIRNPEATGQSDNYTIQTLNPTDSLLEQDLTVSGDVFVSLQAANEEQTEDGSLLRRLGGSFASSQSASSSQQDSDSSDDQKFVDSNSDNGADNKDSAKDFSEQDENSNVTESANNDFVDLDEQTNNNDFIFVDVAPDNPRYEAFKFLKEAGVLSGYPDGTLSENNLINRAELLKVFMLAGDYYFRDLSGGEKGLVNGDLGTINYLVSGDFENCFKDVENEWFAAHVCYAKFRGWVQGFSNGKFKPAQYSNRVEAYKMLLEVFGVELDVEVDDDLFVDVGSDDWFAKYICKCFALGILESLNIDETLREFNPEQGITRGEVFESLYLLMK